MATHDAPEIDGELSLSRSVPLWRNRDYLLLLSGQTVSLVGTQVSQLAFPLLILALTRSPAQAGVAAALRVLPYLGLSLPAGALIDRWDRKRTIILCDTGRAIAMGSIPLALWTGHLSIAQLYLVSLVEGTLYVFFSLALTASYPRVVALEQLPAATAQNEITFNLSGLLGPFLGGFLYGIGRLVPFLTDTVSYAASVVSLLFVKTKFQEERGAAPRRLRSEIVEGLVWLWRQPLIRAIGFLSAIAWIMLSAQELVVIVLARQQHARPATIGLILAAGGVGGIAGSIIASRVQRYFTFGQVIIGTSWLWAILWPLYAVAPNAVALGAVTTAVFIVFPVYNVTQFSYRLALIPDQLQGRVNSVFRLIAFSGQPVGMVLSGALLQLLGPITTVLVISAAPLCLAIGATANRHVRHARPLSEARVA